MAQARTIQRRKTVRDLEAQSPPQLERRDTGDSEESPAETAAGGSPPGTSGDLGEFETSG